MISKSRPIRSVGTLALLLAIPLFAGCGPKTGDVTGKVTFNGKPVVYGTVTFIGADGLAKSGTISDDGSFAIYGVGVGTAKILVESPKPVSAAATPPPLATGDRGGPGGRGGRTAPDLPKDAPKVDRPVDTVVTVSPEVAKSWFPISPDNGDPTKTQLTFTVLSGKNQHDISVK